MAILIRDLIDTMAIPFAQRPSWVWLAWIWVVAATALYLHQFLDLAPALFKALG